jgi:hypothetical protein
VRVSVCFGSSGKRSKASLAYALDRALNQRGATFPLIGLLQGVSIRDVPPALRARLCVSLADPAWREAVRAGLEGRPAERREEQRTRYVWSVRTGLTGHPGATVIEVRPRFGEILHWRFAVPVGTAVLAWGHGAAGSGQFGGSGRDVIDG